MVVILLGVINKKYEQIYIELKVKNNCNIISFDKVSNNKIEHLNKSDISNIINELFDTEKRYLSSNYGYDIYIDSNNFKRFFRNGVEDFNLFYLINGKNATLYKSKKSGSLSKIFTFVIGGVIVTCVFSNYAPKFLSSFAGKDDNEKIEYVVNMNSDEYTTIDLDKIEDYIYDSDGLSSFEKDAIYNEEYLTYLLNTLDENRKIYDLNKRLDGINTSRYDQSVLPGSTGFYDPTDCNTINVLDTITDEDFIKDVESHEFVHLTQCGRFTFIKEALAEIISHEFYGSPYTCYSDAIKRVKVLMEIIGPKAVFNAAFSYNTDYFEGSVKDLLSQKDSKDLLQLFCTFDYTGETNDVTCERMDEILSKMLENKKRHCSEEEALYYDIIISSIMNDSAPDNRFYFNSYKDCYYKSSDVTTFVSNFDCDINNPDIEVPDNILISAIDYSKDNFLNNLNNENFVEFIKDYDVIVLDNGSTTERFFLDESGKYIKDGDYSDNLYDIKDFAKVYNYDSIALHSSLSTYNFNSIKNEKFLNNFNSCYITTTFMDGSKFTTTAKSSLRDCNVVSAEIPSIYEKYGCINPDVDRCDELSDMEFRRIK